MTRMTNDGRPMLTMQEKLVALAHCMAREWHEDAAGHLCDLLEHCRLNLNVDEYGADVASPVDDLITMVKIYGKKPTPIEEYPE